MHGLARIFLQAGIDLVFIGRQQAHFVGHTFPHKRFDLLPVHLIEHAGDDIAFALHCPNHGLLARASAAAHAVVPFIPVTIMVLATDPCSSTSTMPPSFSCGSIIAARNLWHMEWAVCRTKTHLSLNLEHRNSLFASRHQMDDFEPLAQRLVGVFENRPGDHAKAVAVRERIARTASATCATSGHRPSDCRSAGNERHPASVAPSGRPWARHRRP